uniref:Uncharacterized protein n=1 Tax=Klebsiella pneumoniae TaxID=573 RepID=A0A8B0SU48_KLEPN|nr:hypothetical protein [Klebsiella pneumoniae]
MTGDLGLGLIQRRAEIADAQFSQLPEQQDNTQTGFIGQVFLKSLRAVRGIIPPVRLRKAYARRQKNNHIFGKIECVKVSDDAVTLVYVHYFPGKNTCVLQRSDLARNRICAAGNR